MSKLNLQYCSYLTCRMVCQKNCLSEFTVVTRQIFLYRHPNKKNVVLPLRRGNAQLSAHTHYIFLLEIIETGLSYHVKYVVNANNENKAKQS
jgi:hypothetical protein